MQLRHERGHPGPGARHRVDWQHRREVGAGDGVTGNSLVDHRPPARFLEGQPQGEDVLPAVVSVERRAGSIGDGIAFGDDHRGGCGRPRVADWSSVR
jgi:hypothetical protein